MIESAALFVSLAAVAVAAIAHHAFMAWLRDRREGRLAKDEADALKVRVWELEQRAGTAIGVAQLGEALGPIASRLSTLESNERMREGMRRS